MGNYQSEQKQQFNPTHCVRGRVQTVKQRMGQVHSSLYFPEPSTCSTPSIKVSPPQLTLATTHHKTVYVDQIACYRCSNGCIWIFTRQIHTQSFPCSFDPSKRKSLSIHRECGLVQNYVLPIQERHSSKSTVFRLFLNVGL